MRPKDADDLDAAIGDGDHGVNMSRGMNAVLEKLDALALADLSGQMRVISMTLTSSIGGASGPLYGAFFLQCSHATPHKAELGLADLTAAIEAGCRGVVHWARRRSATRRWSIRSTPRPARCARPAPITRPCPAAIKGCRKAAQLAAQGTIPMVARKGRASYLGERSAGTQDPGRGLGVPAF